MKTLNETITTKNGQVLSIALKHGKVFVDTPKGDAQVYNANVRDSRITCRIGENDVIVNLKRGAVIANALLNCAANPKREIVVFDSMDEYLTTPRENIGKYFEIVEKPDCIMLCAYRYVSDTPRH